MPTVNPAITGAGTYAIAAPVRANASASSITPAISPTVSTPSAPYSCTIGTSTTVIAPVGPLTCLADPPNSAASAPATIAVASPDAAPSPEVTPNPSASGRATTATVSPQRRSRRGARVMERKSAGAGRTERARVRAGDRFMAGVASSRGEWVSRGTRRAAARSTDADAGSDS